MNTCPSCGTQIPDGGQFCQSCGAAVTASTPPEPPAPAPEIQQLTPPEPPPYNAPAQPQYASAPAVPPQYPQQYPPPIPGGQPTPKKGRKGLIIGIAAVVLIALLACCGVGAWLLLDSESSQDKAKVQSLETFALGLNALDFDKLRSVTINDVHDELDVIEELLATEGDEWGASTLLASEWEGDTLLMTFEDADGFVSYLKILPPADGGTSLYTLDWDETTSEADAIRTDFELIDEGGWKVYSIDGQTLDTFFSY